MYSKLTSGAVDAPAPSYAFEFEFVFSYVNV